ncbi:hypothetical protein ACFL6C_05975 [Myxococcota bacterium]
MSKGIWFCSLPMAGILAMGCGNFYGGNGDPDPSLVLQNARLSACDGLEAGGEDLLEEGVSPYPGDYCDAEVLHWRYDASAGTLELAHTRVDLNCCGDHDVTIEETPAGLLVTEIDAVPAEESRCRCTCVFDFALRATGIDEGVMHLEFERIYPDDPTYPDGAVEDVWEGDLDLSEGAGWEIISESVSLWC